MMQVLNLRGLLEAIECELAARLQAAQHAPGAVDLCVRSESVRLAWDGAELALLEGDRGGVHIGQDGLMKMVLGLVPVEQVVQADGSEAALLRAVFPVQGTATGIWG